MEKKLRLWQLVPDGWLHLQVLIIFASSQRVVYRSDNADFIKYLVLIAVLGTFLGFKRHYLPMSFVLCKLII